MKRSPINQESGKQPLEMFQKFSALKLLQRKHL